MREGAPSAQNSLGSNCTDMRNPLHSLCPYFAMFPEGFVRDQALRHTRRGDLIFDCFSGRGTTVLEALLMNRRAAAVDINPVAYCVSAAKANLPDFDRLHDRIDDLEWIFSRSSPSALAEERASLPVFFGRAFQWQTLDQLLFLRRALAWRSGRTDRFIAALVLGSLHGEMDKSTSYCSNQMPRTISTKPDYSLRYWRRHGLWPKKRDVFELLRSRAELRFSGTQPTSDGMVAMGDARKSATLLAGLVGQVKAVITSPPYYDVTNFEEDQWLRLWFLGRGSRPTYNTISDDDRHRRKDTTPYWSFLTSVWTGIKPLLRSDAIIVCRIGAKNVSEAALTSDFMTAVRIAFPAAKLVNPPVASAIKNRQRDIFQPGTRGCLFEVDYTVAVHGSRQSRVVRSA